MLILGMFLAILLIYITFFIVKRNSGLRLHPLSVFVSIWIIVIWGTIATIQFEVPFVNIFYFSMIVIASAFTIYICSYGRVENGRVSKIRFEKLLDKNQDVLKRTLIICIIFRIFQLCYDLYIINQLGGNLTVVFGDAQWLRQAYLNYSSYGMSFIDKIISNILNYFAEFGIIIAVLFSQYKKKYTFVIIAIFLSLAHAAFTMSKMSFFMDICYVISCFEILANIGYDNLTYVSRVQQRKERRKVYRLFLIIGIGGIVLLGIASMQRGYGTDVSFLEQVSITFEKAIAYLVTPVMAFFKVMDMDIILSWGSKTFNVIFKLFGYNFETFGAIDVGTEDSTVYTMSGMFYADFGIIGGVLLTVVFICLCSYVFRIVIQRFSISKLAIFISLNTILMMSFFTWMGRMTFFWTFPLFICIYSKLFLKKV